MKPLQHHRASSLAVVAALTLIVTACGSGTSTTSETSAPTVAATAAATTIEPDTTVAAATTAAAGVDTTAAGIDSGAEIDTTAGIEAAQWGDNVTISYGDGTFTFVSNGLPNHELADQYLVPTNGSFTPPVSESEVSAYAAADVVSETSLDVDIPLHPVYSETVTDTNLGMIGVVISGAQQFNDYEDQRRTYIAVDDNFSVNGVPFVDSCNGHPLARNTDGTAGGNYHYHGVPYCITDTIDVAGSHSTILGFLLDGFPLYGPQDVDGSKVTGDDLDECNGHTGPTPEFPNGIYHYHLKEDMSPYTPNCYHGVVASSGSTSGAQSGSPAGGEAPDFSEAAATLGVTEDALMAALGQPPFDLTAAAQKLGVTAEQLEAALPPPPGG